MKIVIKIILTVLILQTGLSNLIAAEEIKIDLRGSDTIKTTLDRLSGKRVSVLVKSGSEQTGTVTKVTQHLIHLSKLSGKSFYDSVIRLDSIISISVRARNK